MFTKKYAVCSWRVLQANGQRQSGSVFPAIPSRSIGKAIPSPGTGRKKFPDGMCGGSLAYTLKAPLILTYKGQEGFAAAYMKENKIEDGYILGGTSAVSDGSGYQVFDTDKIVNYK